jgi:signal transduction histidine kinase
MAKLKKSFVPKARLIKILGEHLIKDATVGVLELVKNCYDADATETVIQMISLNTSKAKIIIQDNGCGIDLQTFLNKWMNPATGHKEEQKINKERSRLGRLPLGEKGVGRFAAQQIGDKLKMISKTDETQQELVVDVDWKIFDTNSLDLQDVEVEYTMESPKHFGSGETGTILEISELKSRWSKDEVGRISDTLKRMKSPFQGASDFNVKLEFIDCPDEFKEFENLDLGDILDVAHYKFTGLVDESGVLSFEYEFNVPGEKPNKKSSSIDLLKHSKINSKIPIPCGSFYIRLYNYYLEKNYNWLKRTNIKDPSKLVSALKGVSIYRDGIRVLPYGEQGNDWLELDKRKRERGEKRKIDNRTTIGFIEIDQVNNLILKDKTNREGFIENDEFNLFHELVFAAIEIFENERLEDVPDVAKKKQEAPKETVDRKIQETVSRLNDAITTVIKSDDAAIRKAATELKTVETEIGEIKKQVDITVDEYETINKQLFNLAGTGLAAERFTHEFSRLIAGANASLDRLKKQADLSNPKVKKEIDTISGALEALRNDIKLLAPMFYIKKVANEKQLSIRSIIDNTLLLQENATKRENIDVDVIGESFSIMMREGSCMQIFNNLIDNSVYWLSRKSENDDKKIKIIIDPKEKCVYLSDSGPGIIPRYRDKIFEPFFSMKGEDGRGLGLYIIKEILQEKLWDISIVNQEDFLGLLKGANFKITFNGN